MAETMPKGALVKKPLNMNLNYLKKGFYFAVKEGSFKIVETMIFPGTKKSRRQSYGKLKQYYDDPLVTAPAKEGRHKKYDGDKPTGVACYKYSMDDIV